MAESLTLELPTDIARRAHARATATNRRVEDVVVEWIGRAATEDSVETLPDADVLALASEQMTDVEQTAMSDLLGRQSSLSTSEREQLEGLLASYRRGLVLKARALKEAVTRGLIPRLNGHGA